MVRLRCGADASRGLLRPRSEGREGRVQHAGPLAHVRQLAAVRLRVACLYSSDHTELIPSCF